MLAICRDLSTTAGIPGGHVTVSGWGPNLSFGFGVSDIGRGFKLVVRMYNTIPPAAVRVFGLRVR